MLDAGLRQPAGNMRTQRTRTADDQRGSARLPGLGHGRRCGADEPARVDLLPPDRDLVFEVRAREGLPERGHVVGEIDEATTPVRPFQGVCPAQPPDERLLGVVERVVTVDRDRTTRTQPHRHLRCRLEQVHRRGEPSAGRLARLAAFVEAQQG